MIPIHIGQKVVCLRNEWDFLPGIVFPIKGHVYTVRDIICLSTCQTPGLRLDEIINAPDHYLELFGELSFALYDDNGLCFKPIVARKTDISIFTKMLLPDYKPENVDYSGELTDDQVAYLHELADERRRAWNS